MTHFQPALQYAPKWALRTLSITLPSVLSSTLPIALDGTLAACLTVCSQVSSLDALNHTPEHPLKYTPNCTRWHSPSPLDCTPPSTLSRHSQEHLWVPPKYTSELLARTLWRGKTFPISLYYLIPCILLHAQLRDLLSCRCQELRGVRLVTYGGHSFAGSELRAECRVWRVAGGRWPTAYSGQHHDFGWYDHLNLIFRVATRTKSHDVSRSWCWQLQAQILQER